MIQLQRAGTNDVVELEQLARVIWNVHYPPIIGQEQVNYMLNLMYSAPALIKQMEEGQQFFFIAENLQHIGYVSLTNKGNGDYFLHKFYVFPDQQGKGIGKQVHDAILKYFTDLKTITLTVNRKNYKSINFYFRVGFVIEEVKDFDIGNGYFMEDFVMIYKKIT
jgi:RimJ/RimL family protein N-acetyltransferase